MSTSSWSRLACSIVASLLVREVGVDLERDEAVDAVVRSQTGRRRSHARLTSSIASAKKTSFVSSRPLELRAELLVVPVAGRERLLEDGRVRRDADHRILVNEPLQLAGIEHLTRERVDPDADSALRELVQPALRHDLEHSPSNRSRRMARVTATERRRQLAQQFRVDSVRMSAAAKSGHPTSSMSAADLLAVLVDGYLRFDFSDPKSPANDRLVFSKGHASVLLYAFYRAAGVVSDADILDYRKHTSMLEGHPTPRIPWVDVATGSLGQGLPIGVGMAIAGKHLDRVPNRVWVLCGDSEMAEGSMWEAFEHAAHYELDNLTAIIDVNRLGQRGETMVGWNLDTYVARAEAFGWNAIEVDGHDVDAIDGAFTAAVSTTGRPTVVVARTLKGKGVAAVENRTAGTASRSTTRKRRSRSSAGVTDVRVEVAKPEAEPTGATRCGRARAPALRARRGGRDAQGVRRRAGCARRRAPGRRRASTARSRTRRSPRPSRRRIPERYFEMYIAEQQLVAAAVGLQAVGWRPFASTFAAFLSRAYDFMRMAAISRATFSLCGSHAGVSIGEDGPSQMALEDIAALRAVHGCTVLHPCDANQTAKLVAAMADDGGHLVPANAPAGDAGALLAATRSSRSAAAASCGRATTTRSR